MADLFVSDTDLGTTTESQGTSRIRLTEVVAEVGVKAGMANTRITQIAAEVGVRVGAATTVRTTQVATEVALSSRLTLGQLDAGVANDTGHYGTTVTDNFNGPDQPVGTTSDGLWTWTHNISGPNNVRGGQVVGGNTSSYGYSSSYINVGLSDGIVQVRFARIGTSGGGIIFRDNGNFNDWRLSQGRVDKHQFGQLPVTVASWTPATAGDTLSVELNGSSIVVKKNGVQVASFTDSYNSTATGHGIFFYDDNSTALDDFSYQGNFIPAASVYVVPTNISSADTATGVDSQVVSLPIVDSDTGILDDSGAGRTTDNFNRSDNGVTLGFTSDGTASWTNLVGTFGIYANMAAAYGQTGSGVGGAFALATIGSAADGTGSVAIKNWGGTGAIGLAFRIADANNFWLLVAGQNSAFQGLWKCVAGTFSQVQAYNVGLNPKVVAVGSSIACYNGATLLGTVTDGFNSSATGWGLYSDSNQTDNRRLDDFSAPYVRTLVSIAQSVNDGGIFTDGATSMATPSAQDASTGSDDGFVLSALSSADSGIDSETATVTNFRAVTDSDAGAMTETVALALATVDAGVVSSSNTITAQLAATTEVVSVTDISAVAAGVVDSDSGLTTASTSILNIIEAFATLGRHRNITGPAVLAFRLDAAATLGRRRSIATSAILTFVQPASATLGRTRTINTSAALGTTRDISATLGRASHLVSTGAGLGQMYDVSATLDRTQGITANADGMLPEQPTMLVQFAGPTSPDGTVPTNPDGSLNVAAGGSVQISLSSGDPGDLIDITADASPDVLTEAFLDDAGSIVNVSVPLPSTLSMGLHELVATGQTSGTAVLYVNIPFSPYGPADPADVVPPAPAAHVAIWALEDPLTQEVYGLPSGPSDVTSPYPTRPISYDVTTSPAGQVITWEGAKRAQTWTLNGRLLEKAQYDTLCNWAQREHRVYLHDPVGRVWLVKITSFQSKPVDAPVRMSGGTANPWVHDWTMQLLAYGRRA